MENYILTLLIFLPVLGAILMLPASKYIKIDNIVKWIAVATTGLQLLLAGWLYMIFDPTVAVMDSPFTVQVDWIKHFNIEYFIGVDGLSIPMVLLTALLSFLCIVASWNINKKTPKLWSDMPWMPGGRQLWRYINQYKPHILYP